MLLVSNVLNRLYPKLPLPFIQIVLGILVGVLARGADLVLDANLFLALVIAPLNFREGQETDVAGFIRYKSIILYLIFPGVFIGMLAVGYVTGYLLPVDMPLAASFALGAALAPTDAVAFIALAKRFAFPKRSETILTLESLLNDASGLVAFQFAVAALTTGAFFLLGASFQLLVVVFGGIAVGVFFALMNRAVLSILEKIDAADVTGALLLELSLPVISYFIASVLGVSGIIAVVIAGLSQAQRFKKIRLFDAEVDRVSQVVWDTIRFVLNGFVFIVFGYELTRIVKPALANPLVDNGRLLAIVIVVTLVLFLVRFLTIFLFSVTRRGKDRQRFSFRDSLLLTVSGVKGTVSIATILLLPRFDADAYSFILFTVAAVTLLSFLTGLVLIPLLAQKADADEDMDVMLQLPILNEVVAELEEDLRLTDQKLPIYAAIDNYNGRIEQLILEQETAAVKKELAYLRLMILGIESDGLEHAFSEGEIGLTEYRIYQFYLQHLERQINRSFTSSVSYLFRISLRVGRRFLRESFSFWPTLRDFLSGREPQRILSEETKDRLTQVYLANTELVLESLADLEDIYQPDLIEFLQRSRLQEAQLIESGNFVERVITRIRPDNIDEMLRGYYLERKVIAEYEARGDISPDLAAELRRSVNKLESYSLKDSSGGITLPYDLYR